MCQDYTLNKSESEHTKHNVKEHFCVHVVVRKKLDLYYLIYSILTLLINIFVSNLTNLMHKSFV